MCEHNFVHCAAPCGAGLEDHPGCVTRFHTVTLMFHLDKSVICGHLGEKIPKNWQSSDIKRANRTSYQLSNVIFNPNHLLRPCSKARMEEQPNASENLEEEQTDFTVEDTRKATRPCREHYNWTRNSQTKKTKRRGLRTSETASLLKLDKEQPSLETNRGTAKPHY